MRLGIDHGIQRIGFVSSRISGTDGVSMEIAKWTEILEGMGCECFFVTGKSDRDPEHSFLIPEAHFRHPDVLEINSHAFGKATRPAIISNLIRTTTDTINNQLSQAVEEFDLDLVIAQNSLTIPANIPLGLGLTELILETAVPCIAHHHDFVWERERFMINSVNDYLQAAFPPRLSEIDHVVINSLAGAEFGRRTGLPYRVIPNVMDFHKPPPPPDDYCKEFRAAVGVGEDDLLILQPTRVVQRKGIEHSIELVRRLEDPRCKLVISHGEDDEGPAYPNRVRKYAELMGVDVIFAHELICDRRSNRPDGRQCFEVWDAYNAADLVAYPSTYEGFGNAFLEAIYFRKPILCNRYTIFQTDIEPLGFRAALMRGFIADDTVTEVRRLLDDLDYREEIVEHNYNIARRYFSFDRVEHELSALLSAR